MKSYTEFVNQRAKEDRDAKEQEAQEKLSKPILCLDFDGVIHDYLEGWRDGTIYGSVTPGFWDWLDKAMELFRIVVYSSRCGDPSQLQEMMSWLRERVPPHMQLDVEFADKKPPAFLTIDDRALTFEGSWDRFDPARLKEFKPWMNR